jgi:hypothetical protein
MGGQGCLIPDTEGYHFVYHSKVRAYTREDLKEER